MDEVKFLAPDASSREGIEQIWAERALKLAQVEEPAETGEQITVMIVRLGQELIGLEVEYVGKAFPAGELTWAPRVPAWVKGITNMHGQILSVIDLRAYLGLPAPQKQPEKSSPGFMVQVKCPAMELIFWVDEVLRVETLKVCPDLTEDPLLHMLQFKEVRAVVERKGSVDEQRHITVIDVNALLTDPRMIIHEEKV